METLRIIEHGNGHTDIEALIFGEWVVVKCTYSNQGETTMNTLTITPTYYDQVYKSWMREFCMVLANGRIDIQLGSKLPERFKTINAKIIRQPQPDHWKS